MDPDGGDGLRRRCRRWWPIAAGAAWVAGVVAGFAVLWRHAAAPGAVAAAPAHWPANGLIALAPQVPTLVTFAHPHCPCTAATLAELAKLASSCPRAFVITVAFYADPALGRDGERAASVARAQRVPGATVCFDPHGATAARFGAHTSGSTVVYDPSGELCFHGGLTGSRGHEGDNTGAAALRDLAQGREPAVRTAAVYGCSLRSPERGGQQ